MRIAVEKTIKMYVAGQYVRSESGRTLAVSSGGRTVHVCRASRKDLRDSVENNRAAQPGWEKRSGYNRGQILYRLAEVLEGSAAGAPDEVAAAVDRAVHHAGWCDKITALLSTLNPVAAAYVNYSRVRPVGVVVLVPHPDDGLLGMVEALCVSAVMGNAATMFVPSSNAVAAAALCEALGTCDLPGGVVNVLTGDLQELVGAADKHDDIDAVWMARGALPEAVETAVEVASARMLKRVFLVDRAARAAGPTELARLSEVQTVWMSA